MSKTTAVTTGRMVSANGQVVNLVDVLGGGTPVSEAQYDIEQYAPHSGLVLGEDGKAYDLTRMLADVTASSEAGQASAEKDRVAAEAARVSAEQQRNSAEQQRQTAWREIEAETAQMYRKGEVDELFSTLFHGGEDYSNTMKTYFAANGAAVRNDLTDIVEGWYKLGRNGWTGGTRFDAPDKSTVSTGTRLGDNAGMVCEPSTNTVAGRDDYATLPLFAVTDCNWELDANGKRHITAIKGIPSAKSFVTDDPTRPVGVLQMAPWCKYEEDENGYEYWFTDQMYADGFYPIPESVDLDGTIHSWVVHAKYGLGDAYSSISNVPIRTWDISQNTQRVEIPNAFGGNNRYREKCSCDDAWIKLHVYIKYASLTLDGIMNGCCWYYYNNCHPAVSETGVKRVIVTTAQGNGLLVGSTMCIGVSNYDANKANQCSVVDRAKILSIEDIDLEGIAYKAVYLDVDDTFDSTTDLFFTIMPWWTGSTDAVLGNDGSPYSNVSSKEPYKLQGIEQCYGCYEVLGDTLIRYRNTDSGYSMTVFLCRDAMKFSINISADYRESSYHFAPIEGAVKWYYIKRLGFDSNFPESMYPSDSGGTSSTYTCDAAYVNGSMPSAYAPITLGCLNHGLTLCGLSCLSAVYLPTFDAWNLGSRLSANASRGEYRSRVANH